MATAWVNAVLPGAGVEDGYGMRLFGNNISRRERRRWIVGCVLGVVGAVGLGLVLWPESGTDAHRDQATPSPLKATVVAPGTPGPATGMWLFGFATIRLDPATLRDPQQLGEQGFGEVVGAQGRVAMFDASTGRLGVLDAVRNDLREVARVPPRSDASTGALAIGETRIWVRTGSRAVTPFTLRGTALPVITLDERLADIRLTSTGTRIMALRGTESGLLIAVIDDATGSIGPTTLIPAPRGEPTAIAVNTRWLWVATRDAVTRIDPDAPESALTIAVPAGFATVVAAAASGEDLFVLSAEGMLARVTAAGLVTNTGVTFATKDGAFQPPMQLFSDPSGGSDIWAVIADASTDAPRDVLVLRIDATGTEQARVRIPSEVFIGAGARS